MGRNHCTLAAVHFLLNRIGPAVYLLRLRANGDAGKDKNEGSKKQLLIKHGGYFAEFTLLLPDISIW